MAVEVTSVELSGTDKKGCAVFKALGAIDGRQFEATTIQWKGEPIFKVRVGGINLKLEESSFSRGERIQIARACKQARLEKFGESHKVTVKPELEPGEMVELSAGTSRAADRRQKRLKRNGKKTPMHPSGLPMNASISALKRTNP